MDEEGIREPRCAVDKSDAMKRKNPAISPGYPFFVAG
jgi:hypothetical protein